MNKPAIVDDLKPLFQPNSVAVIGASNDISKWGFSTFSSIKSLYKGELYAVNNKSSEVLGYPAYSSVIDIPSQVDLAVIVVPAEYVADIMSDCVKKGVKASVIISAGFAEIGEKGKIMQNKVLETAKKGNIRIVGPNCMGMWSAAADLPAFMFPMTIKKGPLGLISQGGNIGGAIVADAVARGIGFQQYVSCGCTADIQMEDYIEYLGNDDSVKIILVYIEGLNDGSRFIKKVSRVTRKKPVLALKPGKTEAAAHAITTHSGSMSGTDSVYEAAFKKAGVLRVESSVEMLDVAIALLVQPLPKGPNVVITTPGGSYGVMCADACALRGLNVIDLPPAIMEVFNSMFPSRWSHGNPVDPAGDRDIIQYLRAPELLLRRPEVDAIIFMGFGSFSAISTVFASGSQNWDLSKYFDGIEDMAKIVIKIIDSGDKNKMKVLIQNLLSAALGKILATKKSELSDFSELIADALTAERMMQRSFFKNLRNMFYTASIGQIHKIKINDISQLMEPIIDALIERWVEKYDKPVITTTFTEGTSRLSEGGHFPYPNSDQASAVLAKLLEYHRYLETVSES